MHKNWLITGGCGFIGINLIKLLIQKPEIKKIVVVDNLSVGSLDHLNTVKEFKEIASVSEITDEGFFFIKKDILDGDFALEVTKDIDVIIHLAANTGVQPSIICPKKDMETNVFGVVNYLEGAKKNSVKNFVLASSGAPAGNVEPPIHEEMSCKPMSPYGASKLAGEGYCSAYYHAFGVNTIALRFSNVYGPLSFHKGSVVASFIKKAIKEEPWTINGSGKQTRDFIFVNDLIRAVIAAGNSDFGGEVIQIGTNVETSILELKDFLSESIKEVMGIQISFDHGNNLKGDMERNFADISKAKRLLNWHPKTELKEGLTKTVEWFDTQKISFHEHN